MKSLTTVDPNTTDVAPDNPDPDNVTVFPAAEPPAGLVFDNDGTTKYV